MALFSEDSEAFQADAKQVPVTRISRDMTIAGVPAFEIRKLLRDGHYLVAEQAARVLSVSERRAEEIMHALEREGFLQPHDRSFCQPLDGTKGVWEVTLKGSALRIAKAGKPIKRSTAERLVAEFLDRVEKANRQHYYAYRITRVLVFGSYLSDRPDLGDIDLGVELTPKWPKEGSYEALTRPRIEAAIEAGRRFRSSMDYFGWPRTEIALFLKNRSRALSLTDADRIPEGAKTKLIYKSRRR